MIAHEFKGGIGTASRRVAIGEAGHTLSAPSCKPITAAARLLRCGGIPVGEVIGPDRGAYSLAGAARRKARSSWCWRPTRR